MAEKRKLQQEIEKTLRRVDEGIEAFDDIYTKVRNSSSAAQREKWENELKREIKKLQRCRDQIKSWQQSSDVKDKTCIDDARKKIERAMERFKACERECKIKAFSKEGLAAKAKIDPDQEIRSRCRENLNDVITRLQNDIDLLEAEEETLSTSKKKTPLTVRDRKTEISTTLGRHRIHVKNLEHILRLVDNFGIEDLSSLDDVICCVEYYIDNYDSPDFHYDETIYSQINMDAQVRDDGSDSQTFQGLHDDGDSTENASVESEGTHEKSHRASGASVGSNEDANNPSSSRRTASEDRLDGNMHKANRSSSTPKDLKSPEFSWVDAVNAHPVSPQSDGGNFREKMDHRSALSDTKSADGSKTQDRLSSHQLKSAASSGLTWKAKLTGIHTPIDSPESSNAEKAPNTNIWSTPNNDGVKAQESIGASPHWDLSVVPGIVDAALPYTPSILDTDRFNPFSPLSSTHFPPWTPSAAAPSFRTEQTSNPNASLIDSVRFINPQAQWNCAPPSFPQGPIANYDTKQYFSKMELDTLFFAFYYNQGTYQQYLAARELKRLSWRFHKKYLMWFQRHEEPRITAEKFEQGAYVYFDYETGWYSRIKHDFTFEYIWLEDELIV